MTLRRWIACLGLGFVLGVWGLVGLIAGPADGLGPGPGKKPPEKKPTNEIVQTFPSNDAMRTAWKIHWATTSGFGLYIEDAWFKKGPKEPTSTNGDSKTDTKTDSKEKKTAEKSTSSSKPAGTKD